MSVETSHLLSVGTGNNARQIAIRKTPGKSPGLIWLGGFRSDMMGTKAEAMVDWAKEHGHASMRFDYSGHGESSGEFTDGTISSWLEDSLSVFYEHTTGPQILVGSSMGGWIALRMVQELNKDPGSPKVSGLLLIAPAPDFTSALMEPSFSDDQRASLRNSGYFEEVSEYSDEPNIITKALIEDGQNNLVMRGIINTNCRVRILQGMQDPDVPYQHALRLIDHLPSDDVTITLVKDGDHRLSRDQDIALIKKALDDMIR